MAIDIICPLYNAENFIKGLHSNISKQKNVTINTVNYVVTKGNDNTVNLLEKMKCKYKLIEKQEFSHSLTREKIAKNCKADIIVFITQDIIIQNDMWLYNLTHSIEKGECEAAYSRQICKNNTIEKYTREKNYPSKSYIISKDDLKDKKLQTFFFSDASAAIRRDIFLKLNGYDGKNLITNEDMYLAYKLITNNYKIKYCADSIVEHSHTYTLKKLYKRYYNTGKFLKNNKYLKKYRINKIGYEMALYILKRAWREKNWLVIVNFLPNMITRFVGMKVGEYSKKI